MGGVEVGREYGDTHRIIRCHGNLSLRAPFMHEYGRKGTFCPFNRIPVSVRFVLVRAESRVQSQRLKNRDDHWIALR